MRIGYDAHIHKQPTPQKPKIPQLTIAKSLQSKLPSPSCQSVLTSWTLGVSRHCIRASINRRDQPSLLHPPIHRSKNHETIGCLVEARSAYKVRWWTPPTLYVKTKFAFRSVFTNIQLLHPANHNHTLVLPMADCPTHPALAALLH